jgi:hypothetical protein
MKFISSKTVNGHSIEATSIFDTALISSAKREDDYDNIYRIDYLTNEVGNTTGLPFRISELTFYAKVTLAKVYITATAEFYDDEEYARFESYASDGMVEFNVELSNSENFALVAFLLNELK